MAVRIFETDPDARPQARPSYDSDDLVGRFHSGRLTDDGPEALSTWRMTTDDPSVGDAVAQLLGGRAVEMDTDAVRNVEVYTDRDELLIVLDGPKAVYDDFKLFNHGQLVHHCDGVEFLSPDEDRGRPCGCPPLLEDRKAAAKVFRGPPPSIDITFRLAEDYDLGKFRFHTGSWKLIEVLYQAQDALAQIDGEALASLRIEFVEFTTKKGRHVEYFKPVLKVLKPWEDAFTG